MSPPPACQVTQLLDGSGKIVKSGSPGQEIFASGTLANCQVAFVCGGTTVAGGLPMGQGVKMRVPNFAQLPMSCTVTAYPLGGQPALPPKGMPFTVISPPSGSCTANSLSPASGPWASMVTLSGMGLDNGCVAVFSSNSGAGHLQFPVRDAQTNQMHVQVAPQAPIGPGRLFVVPAAQAQLIKGGMPSLPFEVTVPSGLNDCEAFDVSPSSSRPGDPVVLTGRAMDKNCAVVFVDARGGQYPAKSEKMDASRLRTFVPLMPGGAAKVSSRLQGGALQKGARSLDMLLGDPAPVLATATPQSGKPGETVTLTGDAFFFPENELVVRLEYFPSRYADLKPIVVSPRQLSVVLPDVFAGMGPVNSSAVEGFAGKISVYRRTPALSSALLDFRMSRSPLAAAPSTPPASPPASPNEEGKKKPGYIYVGRPSCRPPDAGTPTLQADANGFFCCVSDPQVRGGRCGNGRRAYPAGCEKYCPQAGGCLVELHREGCYKPAP